jgi:hypothetical protein
LVIAAREVSKAFKSAIATCYIVTKRHARDEKFGAWNVEYKPAKPKAIDESNSIMEQVEGFFRDTEPEFIQALNRLKNGEGFGKVCDLWLQALRDVALTRFDKVALAPMDQRNVLTIEKIVSARRLLTQTFKGEGMFGPPLFRALGKDPDQKKEKQHE